MAGLWVFLTAAVMALFITPVVIRLARWVRVVDVPGLRKVHTNCIPRAGGLAILLPVAGALGVSCFSESMVAEPLQNLDPGLLGIFVATGVIFLTGLADDWGGMRARTKLFAQVSAAVIVCLCGVRIQSIAITGWFSWQLGWLAWPVTILWIVAITNAINLIDGLDGLAAGIALVACGATAVLAWWVHLPALAAVMAASMGAITGFLFFNISPAKIFLGDCGSLMLGFLLATCSVFCADRAGTVLGLGVPGLAMSIPILDMVSAVVRRAAQRRSIFSPDQQHLHHRLMNLGISHQQTVLLIHIATFVAAGMGMFLLRGTDAARIGVVLCVLALMVVLFRRAGAIRIVEVVSALRRNLALSRNADETRRLFEDAQLRLRSARSFEQWWEAVCLSAEQMGLRRVSMQVVTPQGAETNLSWSSPETEDVAEQVIQVAVPLRQGQLAPMLWMRIAVPVLRSLESAGHTVATFVRLLDECSLDAADLRFAPQRPVKKVAAA